MTSRRLPHDWFPADLPENVRIGEGSWLYSAYAFRHFVSRRPRGVVIGPDTGVYDGTMFDLGPDGEVEIGSFCTIVGAIFCTNRRSVIGDRVFVAHEVVIADEAVAQPFADGAASVGDPAEGVVLEEASWVGAGAVLLPGARVRVGAIVGAGAVVDFEVPPYAIAAGNPGRVVGDTRRHTGAR